MTELRSAGRGWRLFALAGAAWICASCGDSGGGEGGGAASGGGAGEGGMGATGGTGTAPCHNYALVFDGIDDVVDVPDHADLDGLTALTIELRVRPEGEVGAREMELVSHHQHPTHGYALMFQSYRPLMARLFDNGALNEISGGAVPDDDFKYFTKGVWTTIALTFDSTTTALFVDGERVASRDSIITEPSDMDGVLRIGGSAVSSNFHFEGAIDVVRLSKSVRYTEAGPDPAHEWQADADTIGLWRFDEGWGLEALDETGNHHGALDGFVGPNNGPRYERIDCQGLTP